MGDRPEPPVRIAWIGAGVENTSWDSDTQ